MEWKSPRDVYLHQPALSNSVERSLDLDPSLSQQKELYTVWSWWFVRADRPYGSPSSSCDNLPCEEGADYPLGRCFPLYFPVFKNCNNSKKMNYTIVYLACIYNEWSSALKNWSKFIKVSYTNCGDRTRLKICWTCK